MAFFKTLIKTTTTEVAAVVPTEAALKDVAPASIVADLAATSSTSLTDMQKSVTTDITEVSASLESSVTDKIAELEKKVDTLEDAYDPSKNFFFKLMTCCGGPFASMFPAKLPPVPKAEEVVVA